MAQEIVKGFKDFLGQEALKRERIIETLKENFKKYGFEPAETPIIEYEDFVKKGNEQDEAVSDIFKLQDKGKRKLALRYEFTFQLRRIAKGKKLPYKRYQIGPVFSDEPISANRFRQFTQCDVDTVGATIADEAEILALTKSILDELGVEAEININNKKLLIEILDKKGIKEKDAVIRIIDKLDKQPESEVKNQLKKYGAEKILNIVKKQESFFKVYDSYKEIQELKKQCAYYKVKVKFVPSLARGLSYYNGGVFEVKSKAVKETIIAGGSYLVNGIKATGISFGLDRLAQLAKIKDDRKGVLIINIGQDKDAVKTAKKLRDNNIKAMIISKVSKGLEYANSYGLPYVIFIGKEEVKKKKVKLRDMKTGKETLLTLEQIEKFFSINDL